jgi:hypothetical protein
MKNKKTYKRKSFKNKSRKYKMKGGNCGCNSNAVMTGGLANSSFYYPLNTHNTDPIAPAAITDSRLLPNVPFSKGGKRNKKSRKTSRKMKGGSNDTTYLFSKLATPFFPASNYLNPIVSSGTSAGAITSNSILTGNANISNPSPVVHNIQTNEKYLV